MHYSTVLVQGILLGGESRIVSRIYQMIVISWHFLAFTRLVCLAFKKLGKTGAE
jgi:hypothetical protein